jgi:hypothetical protein
LPQESVGALIRSFGNGYGPSNDHSILSFYESVRRQVESDKRLGGRLRFIGKTAKQHAEQLREEMERRGLRFTPIDWPAWNG